MIKRHKFYKCPLNYSSRKVIIYFFIKDMSFNWTALLPHSNKENVSRMQCLPFSWSLLLKSCPKVLKNAMLRHPVPEESRYPWGHESQVYHKKWISLPQWTPPCACSAWTNKALQFNWENRTRWIYTISRSDLLNHPSKSFNLKWRH